MLDLILASVSSTVFLPVPMLLSFESKKAFTWNKKWWKYWYLLHDGEKKSDWSIWYEATTVEEISYLIMLFLRIEDLRNFYQISHGEGGGVVPVD